MNGYEELYNAVKEHEPSLTDDDFSMISENGADWGVMGFTYYRDTIKFYDNNRQLVENFLIDEAAEHGLKNMFELPTLERLTVETITDFKNYAAWYILKTVAHEIANNSRLQT